MEVNCPQIVRITPYPQVGNLLGATGEGDGEEKLEERAVSISSGRSDITLCWFGLVACLVLCFCFVWSFLWLCVAFTGVQ